MKVWMAVCQANRGWQGGCMRLARRLTCAGIVVLMLGSIAHSARGADDTDDPYTLSESTIDFEILSGDPEGGDSEGGNPPPAEGGGNEFLYYIEEFTADEDVVCVGSSVELFARGHCTAPDVYAEEAPITIWKDHGTNTTFITSGSGELTTSVVLNAPGEYLFTAESNAGSATETVRAVKVGLEALHAGNAPDLAPGRICINAQPEYKKAKWRATVLPEGTTATIEVLSGGVSPSTTSVSNGDIFWVEGGTAVGDYEIEISHNLRSSCTDTGGEKVFKFVKEESYNSRSEPMDEVWVGSTYYYPPGYSGGTTRNVKNGNDHSVDFETIAGWHLTKGSGADFTVKLDGEFGVTTDPGSCYSGEVKADLSSHFVGSARNENGVAYYTLYLRVDGEIKVTGADAARDSWNETKSASGVRFTVDAKDGSIDMGGAGTHSCAQRDLTMGTMISGVTGTHTVDLANFEIVSP